MPKVTLKIKGNPKHFLGCDENAQASASLTFMSESQGTYLEALRAFTRVDVTCHGKYYWWGETRPQQLSEPQRDKDPTLPPNHTRPYYIELLEIVLSSWKFLILLFPF